MQPRDNVHDDIVAGRRVLVLDARVLPRLTIDLACAMRRQLTAKVRGLLDFTGEPFARMDPERQSAQLADVSGARPRAAPRRILARHVRDDVPPPTGPARHRAPRRDRHRQAAGGVLRSA